MLATSFIDLPFGEELQHFRCRGVNVAWTGRPRSHASSDPSIPSVTRRRDVGAMLHRLADGGEGARSWREHCLSRYAEPAGLECFGGEIRILVHRHEDQAD